MKIFIFSVFLLCAVFQVHARKLSKDEERALTDDITKAKTSLNSMATAARMLGDTEMSSLMYMTAWGQEEFYKLYQLLLEYKVDEVNVTRLRNLTDESVLDYSHIVSDSAQDPRNIWGVAGLAWFHLDTFILDTLTTHKTDISDAVRATWYGVIDLEEQLKYMKNDLIKIMDALTVGFTEAEMMKINKILDSVKEAVDNDIKYLETSRFKLVDASNKALAALDVVILQVPK